MIDVDRIKQTIDCRDLIERDLGRPKHRNSKYSTYKCPLHNEDKGFSFVVYEDRWICFGKCGHGGDAISWLMEYHNLSFQAACEQLSSGDLPQLEQPRKLRDKIVQPLSEPPDAAWRIAANRIVKQAEENLWSERGKRALHYLKHERGLTEQIILDANLGYFSGHYQEWQTIEGLTVPCGITIPWYATGAIWGIKVRRAADQQRYQQVSGGNIKGCLYLADTIEPGMPLMLTEGEFDALIVKQVAKDIVSVASIGSASNKHINPRWFPKFISAPGILICMDNDEAGRKATSQLIDLSESTQCLQVPGSKDLNKFLQDTSSDMVREWIYNRVY